MTALLLGLVVAAAATPAPTLRDLAKRHGMTISTCVATSALEGKEYQAVLAREFSALEPENELKFEPVQPERNRYDFVAIDKQVAFAKKHKMAVRGHTLVWHHQNPAWARDPKMTATELRAVLKDHIFKVMGRFRGVIGTWDVVNEAISDDAHMRHSLWFDRPGIGLDGEQTIEQAFKWAHEADPKAKLFYNDYNIETLNAKSDAVYALLSKLKQRGVPIDGFGMQCHLDPQFDKDEAFDSFRENIRRFKKLGLAVQLTELDVRIPDGSPAQLAVQARIYGRIFQIAREEGIKWVQLWGFTDAHSWIPQAFKGMGWALPWDDKYQPKPALEAIRKALE